MAVDKTTEERVAAIADLTIVVPVRKTEVPVLKDRTEVRDLKVLVARIEVPVRMVVIAALVLKTGVLDPMDRTEVQGLKGVATKIEVLVRKGEVSSAVQGPKVEIESNVQKTEALDQKIEVQGRMGKDPTPSQNSWIVQ